MLKGLSTFTRFQAHEFLKDKELVFLKADPWQERNDAGEVVRTLGSRVSVLIARDGSDYGSADVSNFGETLVIKVRDYDPAAFSELVPMKTELHVDAVERATVYGQFRNELSLIATLKVAK